MLAQGLTDMAAAGALDGILISQGGFYQTDYTKQILFLGDGSYLDDAATAAHLQGNTWGMMNETGSYPGQAWLWLYSFWYQIPQFNSDEPRRLPDQPCGRAHLLRHGRAVAGAAAAALHPRAAVDPAVDPDPPADLAGLYRRQQDGVPPVAPPDQTARGSLASGSGTWLMSRQ